MTPRAGGDNSAGGVRPAVWLRRLPGSSQHAPTGRGEGGLMSNDHHRQPLPNRRFRRLFPAAVAAVTLAASAPFGAAASAHAETRTPTKAAIVRAPGKIPTQPRASTTRDERVPGADAT
jgi:hypothetical protein